MKRLLFFLLCSVWCLAQQTTPNLGLTLPAHGAPNYDVSLNSNFRTLDSTVGSLQVMWQGVWSSTTTYSKGQVVTSGTTLYVSLVNLNLNQSPASSPLAWMSTGISTGGGGTVTTISVGNLSPIFTSSVATPTTTPAVTYALSSFAAHSYLGNNTGSSAAPTAVQPSFSDLAGTATTGQLPGVTVFTNQANTYSVNQKQTFTTGATTASLNSVGISGGDPSSLSAGDIWFRSDLEHVRFRDAATTTHSFFNADDSLPTTQLSGTISDAQLANAYSGIGGCIASNWIRAVIRNAAPTCTQPGFGDLSGTAIKAQLPATVVYTDQSNTFATGTQDFSGVAHTRSFVVGSLASKPASCAVGETFFGSDAVAGSNFYGCTSPGVWTSENFSNPMTTLGDTLYENSTPAPARLPGNTTATKQYLSQTGTGTVSAAPAWAQVNFADLAGTATKAQLPATTAYTDQSNMFTTGTQDFHQVAHMIPYPTGTFANRPSNCTVGEAYFATDVQYGRNIYGCVATGLWILQSGGLSPTIARFDVTGKNASIATSSFFIPPVSGFYIISGVIQVTTTPSLGATTGTITTNDGTNSFTVTSSDPGGGAPYHEDWTTGLVWLIANQAVTYSTTLTGSNGVYDLHLVAERIDSNIGNVAYANTFTARTTAITSTTAFTPSISGFYRVGIYTVVHTAPTTGTLQVTATFNDGFFTNNNSGVLKNDGITTSTTFSLAASYALDIGAVWVAAGQSITYQLAFNSVTGTPNFDLYAVVELISGNASNTNIIQVTDFVGRTTQIPVASNDWCQNLPVTGMYRVNAYMINRTAPTGGTETLTQGTNVTASSSLPGGGTGSFWFGGGSIGQAAYQGVTFGGVDWNGLGAVNVCTVGGVTFTGVTGSPLYDFHTVFERID